jgi:integrase
MPRRRRTAKIDSRSARLVLPVRGAPYFTSIGRGVALGYRRCKGAGTWVFRKADGKTGAELERIGVADDYEAANGKNVLDYGQAIELARVKARQEPGESSKPATWSEALADYAKDLQARNAGPRNASYVRHHLTAALLATPVSQLRAVELKRWRHSLIAAGKLKPASIVRLLKSARASLNFAAAHDQRVVNRDQWRVGLSGLTDTYEPVNKVLADADVLRLVAEAYQLGDSFGLLIDVLASTGTRTSQACGLLVADLQADRPDPRLMMPSSRKGKGVKQISRKPVPITRALALKLKQAAGARARGEPLLTRTDGSAWNPTRQEIQNLFATVARRTGIDATAYALRHSSIVRSLLAGTPTRVVAAMHDTSTFILERVYSAFILDHADTQARVGLLDTAQPESVNVVALPRGR